MIAIGFGLPIVTWRVDTPIEDRMLVGANCFAIVGGSGWTVRLATLEAAPVAASTLDTPLVWLGLVPMTLLVTTTVTVHDPLIGRVSPLNASAVCPAVNALAAAPGQVPPAALLALICMLASESVNPAPVSTIPFGFVSVNVIVEVPLTGMPTGRKAFAIVAGAAVTVSVVLFDGAPRGASALATPEAWFGWTPGMSAETTTVTVQEPAAGMVRPVMATAVWPAVKALPDAPAQVPPAEPLAATNMFARVSVKLADVSGVPSGLVIVKVIVVRSWDVIAAGEKAFTITGAVADTVRVAVLDTALAGASALVNADVVLTCGPGTLLVTITVTVQEPLAGTVSPVNASAVAPAVKPLLPAPAQLPPAGPVELMAIPLSVSVKAPAVSGTPSVFARVNVMVDVAPAAMVEGENAFAIVGAAAFTVRVAVFDARPTAPGRS